MKQFRQLFYYFLVFSVSILPVISFSANLPDLGNEFRSVLPIEKERLMGQMMMSEIRAAGMSHPDLLVHEYVKHVGNRLTPYMSMPYQDMQIKFVAIQDKSLNAFAFFDGHVAVHSGLIKSTETESELAGVMAHELAHISQQHSIRTMADSKRMMPITIAESIAAIAIGIPELIFPAWASHAQKMLNYSRQFEQEADRIGIQILQNANFDPQGLPSMLERMSVELRFHNMPPEYLMTHPLFDTRISDVRNRTNNMLYQQTASSNMYHLVKARITAQESSNLSHFIEDHENVLNTQRYKNKLAADYMYGYAFLLKGDLAKAEKILQPLIDAYPQNLIIQITAVEIYSQQQKISKALRYMKKIADIYPDSPSVILHYADLLNMSKRPTQAQFLLDKYQTLHKPDPQYYEVQRQTAGILNNQVAVLQANAEWFLLHGDFSSSMQQLSLALEEAKSKEPQDKIKQRIKEISELMLRVKAI